MRQIEFVNDLCCNYLTVPYEGGEEDFALRMMTENTSEAFLAIELRRLDGLAYLYYNISGMQNMGILYGEKPIDRKAFQAFMWQLHKAIEESKELFLAGDGICLDPKFIFWELGMRRWKFLYIPGSDRQGSGEARSERENLAEFLVMHMDYEDKELADTVYHFYEEVCAGTNFSVGDLTSKMHAFETKPQKGYVDFSERDEEEAEDVEPENVETENVKPEREVKLADNPGNEKKQTIWCIFLCASVAMTLVSGRIRTDMMVYGGAASALFVVILLATLVKQKKQKDNCMGEAYGTVPIAAIEFKKTFYKMPGGEDEYEEKPDAAEERTVYMDMQSSPERKLYGVGKCRRQKIFLEQLPCLVGKDKTLADHVITVPSVSRMHAKFSLEGETVWMQDLNSTNGTYHNGLRLSPNEKVALEPEDEIGFGQAQFVFR